ncbi:hypothetical protein FG386_001393 [Cryptosporidium ryanae]|uniref:uncharacterized protein n=1 Tax=Cryptosporidium ryanae TaxID=515981 RepID=UPI00351A1603|nr:hypothetical protein FG386_001393 [Cryptosporidium ryanae]
MTILKLRRSRIKEKFSKLKKKFRIFKEGTGQNLFRRKQELSVNNKSILLELDLNIIEELEKYSGNRRKSFEYDSNYLPLKEYMVGISEKSLDYNNLLINDSIKNVCLSSNISEEIKFYSIEYSNDEFMKEYKFDHENNNLNGNSLQNEINPNVKAKYKKEESNNLNNSLNNKNNSWMSLNKFPYLFLSQQSPNNSKKKNKNEMSLDNVNMENKEEYINSEELHMLFLKIRHLMKEKYIEYKELTSDNSFGWDEYGSKNGIKFFKKKDGSNNNKNIDKYTSIRGVIEVNLNKENDLLYNEFGAKKKISFSKNYHLGDLITSKEFVNYLWSTDPLTYDNTVDNSYRVHTWSDDNPGYCVYYHSYKGALGVQGRDFLLFGYKNHSEIQSYGHLTKLTTSSSISSIYSPISTIKNNSSVTSPFSLSDINDNYKNDTGNSSNNKYMILPIKSKRKFNRKKNIKKDNNSDNTSNNGEVIIDSSFFISSDLAMELSENNLYKLMREKNNTPSFIRGKCYLNGVKIDKLINRDNQKIVRMDIIWIGDLNGKLPEFIKKSLLFLSISTMKILKDKYIDFKKRELLDILENN